MWGSEEDTDWAGCKITKTENITTAETDKMAWVVEWLAVSPHSKFSVYIPADVPEWVSSAFLPQSKHKHVM